MEITQAFENIFSGVFSSIAAERWYLCQRQNLSSLAEKGVALK